MADVSKQSCSTRVLWFLTFLFLITTLMLFGILMWREFGRGSETTRKETKILNSTTATVHYRGYFRTEQEQTVFRSYLYVINSEPLQPVNKTIRTPENCSVTCLESPNRRRRASPSTYHGCCQSSFGGNSVYIGSRDNILVYVQFIAPNHYLNANGVNRTFVQYPLIKQYFMTNVCAQASGCSGSVCQQGLNLHTAVVMKTGVTAPDTVDDTEIDFFYFPGCCKSVNT